VQYASEAADHADHARNSARWVQCCLATGCCTSQLRIVDAEEGQVLNRDFRGKGFTPPMCWTFVYDDTEPLSGDIVICCAGSGARGAGTGKTLQAPLRAHDTACRAAFAGYDHESEGDAAEMEALETALMVKLGYPAPYAVTT